MIRLVSRAFRLIGLERANETKVTEDPHSTQRSLDVLLAYYESARTELIQRVQLRDQALLFFLTVAGVVISAAFGVTGAPKEILLSLPPLSLGFAAIVYHHNNLIGWLSTYCAVELRDGLMLYLKDVEQWDRSKILGEFQREAFFYRLLAHIGGLVGPALFALVASAELLFSGNWLLWVASAVFVVLTIGVVTRTYRTRVKLRSRVFK